MTELFRVRPAVPADFSAWKTLWDGYNAFYGRSGPTALDEATTETTWSRFFDDAEPMHALVAEGENGLLGLAHFLYHRSTISIALSCYLHDLFTVEAARGKGVGGALIEAVYARSIEAGASRLYWLTQETNATARRLYDRVAQRSGFIVYRK